MQNKAFLAFWGWQILPWNEPTPVDQLFWQERTELVASRLLFSLHRAAQLAVIAAPPGHGKSTFAQWLYRTLDPKTHDAAIFSIMHRGPSSSWLLQALAHYLGSESTEPKDILTELHRAQLHGRLLTLIIDEAHNLSGEGALESLLSLGQMSHRIGFGINFVLIGRPELLKTLQATQGVQHRLNLCTELQTLSPSELAAFVGFKLNAWQLGPKTLQSEALDLLIQYELGTFAAVEQVLETCLMEAFLRDQRSIGADTMVSALKYLGLLKNDEQLLDSPKGRLGLRRRPQTPASQRASAAALDLNSLYYKSDDGQDPEQS